MATIVAASSTSGTLYAGFARASEMLSARCKLRDQLVSALSYPLFVLLSSALVMLALLLFVVPALAPVVQDESGHAPASLAILIAVSHALTGNVSAIMAAILIAFVIVILFARSGLLTRVLDRILMSGPFGRSTRQIVYGGFAVALGAMIAGGAALGDALRLAIRATQSHLARQKLEKAALRVRQGVDLSVALGAIEGFPDAIARMCEVGERSGRLGDMLARSGRFEEDHACRGLERFGRVLGPILILLLGAVVGLLMAGLLSGLNQVGQGIGAD